MSGFFSHQWSKGKKKLRPDTTPPAPPTGLYFVSATDSSVTMGWTASVDSAAPDFSGYIVWRATSQFGLYTRRGTVYHPTTNFVDTGLTYSTTYWYKLMSFDISGNESALTSAVSGATSADITPPTVPTPLLAYGATPFNISLQWNASSDPLGSGVARYEVWRALSEFGSYSQVGTSLTTSFLDVSLTPSTTYWYQVRAVDVAGNPSGFSNKATDTTEGYPANTPPVWTVPDNYQLPQFTTAGGTFDLDTIAFDAEGDPMAFTRTGGTAPGSVTVSSDGVLTVPAGLSDGTYVVRVGLDQAAGTAEADWVTRSTAPGVVWAHSFDTATEVSRFDTDMAPSIYPGEVVSASWQAGAGAGGLPGFVRYRQPGNGPSYRIIAATYLGGGITEFQTGSSLKANSGAPVAHGYTTGDQISFQSMSGGLWNRLNRTFGKSGGQQFSSNGIFLTVTAPDKFTIPLDSSTWGTYTVTPGGRCKRWSIGIGSWNRPLSPIVAGDNGKATADHAKGGTMTRRNWAGTRLAASAWNTGHYSHADYHSTSPGYTAADFDGSEYYLQYRVRFSAGRFRTLDQPGGKLIMHSGVSGDVDHLIEQAIPYYRYAEDGSTPPWDESRTLFGTDPAITARPQLYATKWAFATVSSPPAGFPAPNNFQTDAYPNTCYYVSLAPNSGGLGQGSGYNACWWWPEEQWVTVLMRVKFGKQNTPAQFMDETGTQDMTIEMWVAKQGETQYTKIFSENRLSWRWQANDGTDAAIKGWNAVRLTSYANEEPFTTEAYHDFDQVILSHDFIPCPQV